MVYAIIAAAGRSRRMGGIGNKLLLLLNGLPVVAHSLKTFEACSQVDKLVIVTSADEVPAIEQLVVALSLTKPCQVVIGGSERQYSIANALRAIPSDGEFILVHDGARPLMQLANIESVIDAARIYRAAGVAAPVKDTIKVVDSANFAISTPDRSRLWAIQTPQAFEAGLLRNAYAQAEAEGYLGTDDASLVERLGVSVKLVDGGYENIKITTSEDICLAEALLARRMGEKSMDIRFGIGYDVHQLKEGRRLILGGVDIPHCMGLDGHSDADVLLHAIKDSLLGAAGMGDIGKLFPDTDMTYKGVSSLWLLERVRDRLIEKGWKANNIDATIVAQKPKLASYIPAMQGNIAETLRITSDRVNIKATTTEGLGFAGREEGIAAYAIASLTKFD